MKHLLSLVVLLFSLSAFAGDQKVTFTYLGNQGGMQSYYACSFVEERAHNWLELFGATDIEVHCSGGLETWSTGPIRVSATFNLPVLSGREVAEVVSVRGDFRNSACGLNTQMVKNFLKVFSNIEVLKKQDSCAFPGSNYSYEFSIVR
jgi:hypothetical protein